jgi:hypothetical protein
VGKESELIFRTDLEGEKMERAKFFRQIMGLLFLLILAGCNASETASPPTPYPDEVDWETAVEILNTGEVEMVVQLHSLDVMLTMKDGSEIHTVEPTIDAIFDEIERCGEPCSQIALTTE